jgi:hypothetical protein
MAHAEDVASARIKVERDFAGSRIAGQLLALAYEMVLPITKESLSFKAVRDRRSLRRRADAGVRAPTAAQRMRSAMEVRSW